MQFALLVGFELPFQTAFLEANFIWIYSNEYNKKLQVLSSGNQVKDLNLKMNIRSMATLESCVIKPAIVFECYRKHITAFF